MTLPSGVSLLNLIKNKHLPRPRTVLGRIALATWLAASVAFGAQVEPTDYQRLAAEVNATGAVAVAVGLDVPPTLRQDLAAMEEKAKPLLSELGTEIFEASYWNNGLGQIGFYVTANGLQILLNSSNAKSFMPDVTSKMRSRVYDSDGSLDAVEAAINANGFADVEVFLNVDEGDYDIGRDGKTTFRPSAGLSTQIAKRFNSIMMQKFAAGFQNIDTSPSQAAIPNPSFRVRIDRNAFYGLRVSSDARAIRPIGFIDPRPAQWPNDALTEAKTSGSAEVSITLRGGSIYSSGYMSVTAIKAQADANQRAFEDILSSAGVSLSSLNASTYFNFGTIAGHITYETLVRLYENADPRILSIHLNQPAAWITQAPQQIFTTPAEYCFFETVLHGELTKTTLDHNLVIAENDRFKVGDVFVGFRLRSRPDELWLLTNYLAWPKYDDSNPIAFDPYDVVSARGLQPVIPVPIIPLPLDLTAFSGDGEIWVGYGIRNNEAATVKDSFQDMLSNRRYSRVWAIGNGPVSDTICLTATQMRVVAPVLTLSSSPSLQ